MPLSGADILAAQDLETREVEVKQWGGSVIVRALSGKERDAYEASCMVERPAIAADGKRVRGQMEMHRSLLNIRAKLVVRALVDEGGNRLFKDTDAAALGEKSGAALDQLFDVAAELSGLTAEDVDALANFSGPDPSDDSSSA
jgi:hypothetical protein